jgi:hypothetical protein
MEAQLLRECPGPGQPVPRTQASALDVARDGARDLQKARSGIAFGRSQGEAPGTQSYLPRQSFVRRSRSAFPMTEIELKLIAAAAIMGLSRMPVNG